MGRREQNKADKHERILGAGLATFLEHGYAAGSVESVAAAAAIARGTFYLYFPDKLALFHALVDPLFDPLGGVLTAVRSRLATCEDPAATFPIYAEMGVGLALVLLAHVDVLRIVYAESRARGQGGDAVRLHLAAVVGHTEGILVDAVQRGTLRAHDCHAVALTIVGGVERLVAAWLDEDRALDPTGLAAEVTALFQRGLLPER